MLLVVSACDKTDSSEAFSIGSITIGSDADSSEEEADTSSAFSYSVMDPVETQEPITLQIYANGGTVASDLVSGLEIVGSTPIKDGYVFAGWYSDSALTTLVTENNYVETIHKTLYAKWTTVETYRIDIRTDTATITDSGRENQKYDLVNLSSYYDQSVLAANAYDYYDIILMFDVKEIYDGYQYIFFYSSSVCQDSDLLYQYNFEHYAGEVGSVWEEYSINFQIPVSDIDGQIYIRYGSSGTNDDDWMNKNIKMIVRPVQQLEISNGGGLSELYTNYTCMPTKDGYIFNYWCSDSACTNEISMFEYDPDEDELYAKWTEITSINVYTRESTYNITDSGRENQPYDVIPLSDYFDSSSLIKGGYTKYQIDINLDVIEYDNGYQYIFFYPTTESISAIENYIGIDDDNLLETIKFIHKEGSLGDYWGDHSFSVVIDISDLSIDLVLRYGASGDWSDDWANRDLVVTVTPIK